MKNRGNKILELLTKDNKIEVSHLAEELGVSQVTMLKGFGYTRKQGSHQKRTWICPSL